jgi:hypothetical protein
MPMPTASSTYKSSHAPNWQGRGRGDADRLTALYSGWNNGLARKHYMDVRKSKEAEHEVIMYKANPEHLIIEAIANVFKYMRTKLGIEMKT